MDAFRQRPKGALWSSYASGEMTAGERTSAPVPEPTRRWTARSAANARCLSEGSTCLPLTAAFIDPDGLRWTSSRRRRAIASPTIRLGTIVIPVFIDTEMMPRPR